MQSLPTGSRVRWRTRADPFHEHWDEVVELLTVTPELEAITVFGYLRGKYPGRYEDGQVRTLQRRLRRWRAEHGEAQELFFDQIHEPGATAQLDWTDGTALGVKVGGEPFAHKLCHCAAVYSKWEWATVCFGEDFLSLRLTLEEAFTRLGGVPRTLAVDNGSAATRWLHRGEGKRDFNAAFQHLLNHFGMEGRRINIGQAHENGSEGCHACFTSPQSLIIVASMTLPDLILTKTVRPHSPSPQLKASWKSHPASKKMPSRSCSSIHASSRLHSASWAGSSARIPMRRVTWSWSGRPPASSTCSSRSRPSYSAQQAQQGPSSRNEPRAVWTVFWFGGTGVLRSCGGGGSHMTRDHWPQRYPWPGDYTTGGAVDRRQTTRHREGGRSARKMPGADGEASRS